MGINLQTLQGRDLFLTLENIIRGRMSSVMGDRYIKSDENKKTLYMEAIKLCGHSLSQVLPLEEIEMWHGYPDLQMNRLEEILYTPDDSDIGYFIEVDLKYPDNIKEKTKISHLLLKIKLFLEKKYNEYKKKRKLENYTKAKKLICDWTDKKNYLIHYRMLKFYGRHDSG